MFRDEKHYPAVIEVTKLIRQRERSLAIGLAIASLLNLVVYIFLFHHRAVFMLSVLFFGLSISLIFKRDADIKLGGLSTFALILYYSLENIWLPLHFILIWALALPIAIVMVRRGYLGPFLFYAQSIIILPISTLSYLFFDRYLHYPIISGGFGAEEVIYVFMPLIYVHTTLTVERSQISHEGFYFFGLLSLSLIFWFVLHQILGLS